MLPDSGQYKNLVVASSLPRPASLVLFAPDRHHSFISNGFNTTRPSVPTSLRWSPMSAPAAPVAPFSVAYRQHPEKYNARGSGTQVKHVVTDTLALIAILSDPANYAPLEAEKAIAKDWYRRSHEPPVNERPCVTDRPQPLCVPPSKRQSPLLELPWQDEGSPHVSLHCDVRTTGFALGDHRYWTRIGDVQYQPLSTLFRGDCKGYCLIVLDISDLNSGV
ncbi:hypothetical protein N7468_001719 [Penicillium chermesinum]|uniref:Uncharacterized protein n=1 Tax=Penicillium chermesinum TaxID=63820 RepID=A0A9W9PH34_9EURO|nr:uncharacterized protein N7468_001719 [Penicillium chermesinum]KAJ5246736.1 hypothetical protein N7468_001719 [Penicillium chermesinum]